MKRLTLVLIFFRIGLGYAQTDSLVIETFVVDTSYYNGRPIAIFNNGDWDYLDEIRIERISSGRLVNGVVNFDPKDLFSENWRNTRTVLGQLNCSLARDTIKVDIANAVTPVQAKCNSGFKYRWGKWHQGNDYAANTGTPVACTWKGVVRYAQFNSGGFGNLVIVRHFNGLETYYAHLSKIHVKINDTISAGGILGKVGSTGHSTGPHLHFEVRFFDSPFNPGLIFSDSNSLELHSGLFVSMPKKGEGFSFKDKLKISSKIEPSVSQKVVGIRKRKTFSTVK